MINAGSMSILCTCTYKSTKENNFTCRMPSTMLIRTEYNSDDFHIGKDLTIS